MKQMVMAAAVCAAVALGSIGCKSKPKAEPLPPPPDAMQVSVIREQFATAFPTAKVGVVSHVLDDHPYLRVEEIDTTGLKTGDLLTIIDSTQTPIAYATVEKVTDGTSLAAKFDAGQRRPMVGDVAVKF